MKLIKLNKKQDKEMKRIVKWFMKATEPIEDTQKKLRQTLKYFQGLDVFRND